VKLGGVLIVGLMLGLVGGLIFTWFVMPITYYNTYPPLLSQRYRQDWIRMTVWTYGLEGNWDRTEVRLLNMPASEVRAGAVDVLEEAVAQGQPLAVLQRLASLASAYGADNPAVTIYVEDGAAPTPAGDLVEDSPPVVVTASAVATKPVVPTATLTPVPLPSPTFTPDPDLPSSPFEIVTQTLGCEPSPKLAVSLEISRTVEERGRETVELVEQPQRELWLLWEGGADRALTGFKPELGLGYADFTLEPGRAYNLYVDSPTGLPVLTVQAAPCTPQDGEGWVSRFLILREEIPLATPESTITGTPGLTVTQTLTPTSTP
jgi:hypothetical protein